MWRLSRQRKYAQIMIRHQDPHWTVLMFSDRIAAHERAGAGPPERPRSRRPFEGSGRLTEESWRAVSAGQQAQRRKGIRAVHHENLSLKRSNKRTIKGVNRRQEPNRTLYIVENLVPSSSCSLTTLTAPLWCCLQTCDFKAFNRICASNKDLKWPVQAATVTWWR